MSSSIATIATVKRVSFTTSSALNTRTVSNLPRSPMPRFAPSGELDFDPGYDAGCETSPSPKQTLGITVYRKRAPIRIPKSPIGWGCKHFVAFTKSIPAVSPATNSTNFNVRAKTPIGLGLGNIGGFFGTITTMNNRQPPFSRRGSQIGLRNQFDSPIPTIVTTPVGLGLGNIFGFYGTIATVSPTSSTISLPNPFAGPPVALGITLVDGTTGNKRLVGLGFSFIGSEQTCSTITSRPASPLIPHMKRGLSEPQRRNLVLGPFLVTIGSSPILPYVARSQSLMIRKSVKDMIPLGHMPPPPSGRPAFVLRATPNLSPLVCSLTPSPSIYGALWGL